MLCSRTRHYSQSATLHPGVKMDLNEFNAGFHNRLIVSHQDGSRNTASRFMLLKLEIRVGLMGHLTHMQTFCFLPRI